MVNPPPFVFVKVWPILVAFHWTTKAPAGQAFHGTPTESWNEREEGLYKMSCLALFINKQAIKRRECAAASRCGQPQGHWVSGWIWIPWHRPSTWVVAKYGCLSWVGAAGRPTLLFCIREMRWRRHRWSPSWHTRKMQSLWRTTGCVRRTCCFSWTEQHWEKRKSKKGQTALIRMKQWNEKRSPGLSHPKGWERKVYQPTIRQGNNQTIQQRDKTTLHTKIHSNMILSFSPPKWNHLVVVGGLNLPLCRELRIPHGSFTHPKKAAANHITTLEVIETKSHIISNLYPITWQAWRW